MSRKQLLNFFAPPKPAACPEVHVDTPEWLRDELLDAWAAAQDEATAAYRAWCGCPGSRAYAAYRAAQDRADAAQDALAAEAGRERLRTGITDHATRGESHEVHL